MASTLTLFDAGRIRLKPLSERVHDLDASIVMPLDAAGAFSDPGLAAAGAALVRARARGAASVMMMGGHVVRSGVQRFIIDLMGRGLVTCLSMNGAVMIHDFELALAGATTESVSRYISEGQFGLWRETGCINDIVNQGAREGLGLGEAVGKAVVEGDYPFAGISLLAQAYRLGIPALVHVGIGQDIIHSHPNFDGAATGQASHRDFLALARQLDRLEGGTVMNFGSAVMAPEVYLKALAMARNAALGEGRSISRFLALVCDLRELPPDYREEASKSDPGYYFRPWKTMLVRTVADGGESHYVRGRHADTVPALWRAANSAEAGAETGESDG